MNAPPVQRWRSRAQLLLIAAIFVLPIVVAWLFTSGVIDSHSRGRLNRGELITPPVDLAQLGPSKGLDPLLKLAPSEWAALVIEPTTCAAECAKALDRLLTIRELIGQGAVRVSVHALAAAASADSPHLARIHIDANAVTRLVAVFDARRPMARWPAIMLLDWRHQLMMRYAIDASPRDILEDLKRVLRASEIR